MRARAKRCGKTYSMPRRASVAEVERDQELLSQISTALSQEQVESAVASIKRQREAELSGQGPAETGDVDGADKRARVKRSSRDVYLPRWASAAERERDQQLLDSIPHGLSGEAFQLRYQEIRAQRDREIQTGLLETSVEDQQAPKRRKRSRAVVPLGEHARMLSEALAHQALKCFRLTGPHTEYMLLSPANVNVFPGFRNFGNTCWLNATLQCMLHTPAIRAHLLRKDNVVSAVDIALKRICKSYWAISSVPKHSVIAPLDLPTALILERPQFGGALQQDVGEVLQCLQLAPVSGVECSENAGHVCVEGVTQANLDLDTLQCVRLPLQSLWDRMALEWDDFAMLPSCLVVAFPSVYNPLRVLTVTPTLS